MSQMTITAHIVGQAVQMTNVPLLASGIEGALKIKCTFSEEWEGYAKTAVFYRNEEEVYHVLLTAGEATVPAEVLTDKGFFHFGIMGTAEGGRTLTTEVLKVGLVKGALTTATAEPAAPAPDIYQEILSAYGKVDSRLNALVAMRGNGGAGSFPLSDEYISGTIKSNGFSAYTTGTIYGLSLVAGGYHYTDYCIPPELASLCPVELQSSNPDLNITLEAADTAHGWSRLLIENPSSSMYTTDMETTISGTYPLARPYNPEVGDLRVGADGVTYDTAGEAIRSHLDKIRNLFIIMGLDPWPEV